MSYHSCQLYLALVRLLAARSPLMSPSGVDCSTVVGARLPAYEVTADSRSRDALACLLQEVLSRSFHSAQERWLLDASEAHQLMRTAFGRAPRAALSRNSPCAVASRDHAALLPFDRPTS
jgi:hypothetical protein